MEDTGERLLYFSRSTDWAADIGPEMTPLRMLYWARMPGMAPQRRLNLLEQALQSYTMQQQTGASVLLDQRVLLVRHEIAQVLRYDLEDCARAGETERQIAVEFHRRGWSIDIFAPLEGALKLFVLHEAERFFSSLESQDERTYWLARTAATRAEIAGASAVLEGIPHCD